MEDTDLKWRTASYSSNGGGNCVEVADHTQSVIVRDTQDRTGPVLRFSPAAWREFADQVKRSLAADLAGLTFPESRTVYQTARADDSGRCFGWKIWSMTSAPVVITGRSSRR